MKTKRNKPKCTRCGSVLHTNMDCGVPLKRKWEILCKRTDDPKLAWLERQLTSMGVITKREGESWHADHILWVLKHHKAKAYDLLNSPAPARLRRWYKTIDDIPDDHPMFTNNEGNT